MAEKTTEKETVKRKTEENVIFVGSKPPMSYVLAVVTEFNKGSADESNDGKNHNVSSIEIYLSIKKKKK